MGSLKVPYKQVDGFSTITTQSFRKFNPTILDVGDISQEGRIVQSIAAIFDLEGFTDFCNQTDSHLVVPEFCRDFLSWLFNEVATELTQEKKNGKVTLWCQFPFFAKFMGDGVLFLWDTAQIDHIDMASLVAVLYVVCEKYESKFFPSAARHFSKPPKKLRCGIARGQVIGLGNGGDYVGACINLASRLQKLGGLSFAFSRKGFKFEGFNSHWKKHFTLVNVPVRGIGEREPVYVVKGQLAKLSPEERATFE